MPFEKPTGAAGDCSVSVGGQEALKQRGQGHVAQFAAIGLLGAKHGDIDATSRLEPLLRQRIGAILADFLATKGGLGPFDGEDEVSGWLGGVMLARRG